MLCENMVVLIYLANLCIPFGNGASCLPLPFLNTRRKCKFSFVIKSCSGIRYHCCRCHFTLRAIHDAYVQVKRSYAPTPRIFALLTGAQRHHFQMVWFEFEGIAWYRVHMCSTCVLSVILSSSKNDIFPSPVTFWDDQMTSVDVAQMKTCKILKKEDTV